MNIRPRFISKHIALVIITFILLSVFTSAWSTGTEYNENPFVDSKKEPVSQEDTDKITAQYQNLMSKAIHNGRIPIIVKLKHDDPPTSPPDKTVLAMHQLSLFAVQDKVMNQIETARRIPGKIQGLKRFRYTPAIALHADPDELETLIQSPDVAEIFEDKAVPPTLRESVPLIGADNDWRFNGYTGQGQVVAILDTGVDKIHEFLSGKVVSEACYSSNMGYSTSLCPGGYESSTAVDSGVDCDMSITGCGHGTHVAGIAAGSGTNFTGVASDADIIAIQVFSKFFGADCTDYGYSSPCVLSWSSDQIRGLERVYDLRNSFNIASANMSIGGGRNTSTCDDDPRKPIIDSLKADGTVTAIASGNNGYVDALSSPACISSALSVGSSTKSDMVSNFSNSSYFLDVLAPGSDIYSSTNGGGFEAWNGTSMAAPHVAGAWAVLKQANPTAEVNDILDVLTSTGMSIIDNRAGAERRIKPRIQLDQAIDPDQPVVTAPVSISVPFSSNTGNYIISWSRSSTSGVTYVLEESTNTGFTSNLRTPYTGMGTSAAITGRTNSTTYYYRVKATKDGYTDSRWRKGSNGCYVNIASCTLPQALDTMDLTWTTGGDADWFCQTIDTFDGEDAARSGAIANNQETWVQTTVTGPGTIHFWWKVSSESDYDFLSFAIGDDQQERISGITDWSQQTFQIPSGQHILNWSYTKDVNVDSGSDAGWLDQVVWNFDPAPVPTNPTLSVSVTGTTVNLSWSADNADTYILYAASYPDATGIFNIFMGTQTSTSFELTDGSAYYVAMMASNTNGRSALSNIEYFVLSTDICGANVAPGVWKEFDCYNLAAIGKTTSADPFIPSWELIGGYWQWGRKGPSSNQWHSTNTEHFAHGPTGPGQDEANEGEIRGWEDDWAPDGSWSDSYKTANDPCPAGFRVPTIAQWEGVIDNNTQSTVGAWDNDDYTNYSSARFFGDDLILPAAGYRSSYSGMLGNRGYYGYYWSTSEYGSNSAWHLGFHSGDAWTYDNFRRFGFSVRCVAE